MSRRKDGEFTRQPVPDHPESRLELPLLPNGCPRRVSNPARAKSRGFFPSHPVCKGLQLDDADRDYPANRSLQPEHRRVMVRCHLNCRVGPPLPDVAPFGGSGGASASESAKGIVFGFALTSAVRVVVCESP